MMDTSSLLASYMSSNQDTHSNLPGTIASLMPELVITNKNLTKALKEKFHLDLCLSQCQSIGGTGGGGANVRGGTTQHKKGVHYCLPCRYDAGNPILKCMVQEVGHARQCSEANTRGGSQKNNPE